jgi:hypothetical protein
MYCIIYGLSRNGGFWKDPTGLASNFIFRFLSFLLMIGDVDDGDGGSGDFVASLADGLVMSIKPALASSSAEKTVKGFV